MNQDTSIDFGALIAAVSEAGLMLATATIQRFNGAVGQTGTPAREVDGNWAAVSGMSGIACQAACDVRIGAITNAKEVKGPEAIAIVRVRHLLFAFTPGIVASDRAVVTLTKSGTVLTLDITGVEADSQESMTRVAVQDYTL